MEERIDRKFDKVDAQFESINQKFEKIDDQFEIVNQKFGKIDDQFVKVDVQFEKVNEQLERIETTLIAVSETANDDTFAILERIDRNTKDLNQDIEFLSKQVGKHEMYFNRVNKN